MESSAPTPSRPCPSRDVITGTSVTTTTACQRVLAGPSSSGEPALARLRPDVSSSPWPRRRPFGASCCGAQRNGGKNDVVAPLAKAPDVLRQSLGNVADQASVMAFIPHGLEKLRYRDAHSLGIEPDGLFTAHDAFQLPFDRVVDLGWQAPDVFPEEVTGDNGRTQMAGHRPGPVSPGQRRQTEYEVNRIEPSRLPSSRPRQASNACNLHPALEKGNVR